MIQESEQAKTAAALPERRRTFIEGSMAIAEAVKLSRPKVISAYPITPQTHIVEDLAKMVADGELDAQYIPVESEFSAASAIYGASLAGVRAYTASSSQGLLLMTEVLYNAAGTRLPIVLTGANRTLSAPISILPDHQDTISLRDPGIVQLYVEDCQEAHDAHIQAFRIAEDPGVLLPTMVCVDGWMLTHTFEPVALCEQEVVDRYLPPYRPVHYANPEKPMSWGFYVDDDLLMEFRYEVHLAMRRALEVVEKAAAEFETLFGRHHGGLIQSYRTEDAEVIVLAMGSVVGTIKEAIDGLREEGHRVGLVKVRCFRPFPAEAIYQAVKGARALAVLDRNISMGQEGALASDLKAAFYHRQPRPAVVSFVAGLAGREVSLDSVRRVYERTRRVAEGEESPGDCIFLDLNQGYLDLKRATVGGEK